MPSLSVVSPLDVLRESQMNRILADKINANNAFLSRLGKRGEPVGLLQVSPMNLLTPIVFPIVLPGRLYYSSRAGKRQSPPRDGCRGVQKVHNLGRAAAAHC